MTKNNLQKAISDMEESNKDTDDFLKKMQAKIDAADLEYLKINLESDIDNDKLARDILSKKR
jgi:hypothetical protein